MDFSTQQELAMVEGEFATAEGHGKTRPNRHKAESCAPIPCTPLLRLVFTAGNADTFSRVLMTMKLLKKFYNTTLPAEVFSFPGEMPPDDLLPRFKEYNVTLRYVSGKQSADGTQPTLGSVLKICCDPPKNQINDASRDESRTKNYQIKSDAIVASSFAEVLYLDSDNMPAAYLGNHDGTWDPSLTTEKGLIWNAPAYKRLGAMFWPDYWKTGPMNPIWGIIGYAGPHCFGRAGASLKS